MKRPNGSGTVVKLNGIRRRPFVVRVATRDRHGYVVQKPLGYYATTPEAYAALDDYNAKKKQGLAPQSDKLSMTLGQVYEAWSAREYAKEDHAASIRSHKASWGRLSALSDIRMRELSSDHLQCIIDEDMRSGASKSKMNNDKFLMKALFRYAMERDIVMKDYSAFVEVPAVGPKYEKGVIDDLKLSQLETWAAHGDPWADTVLMLCYTGFRISELLYLAPSHYNRKEEYLQYGIKTAAGRGRIMPVHPKIKPYLERRLAQGGETILCSAKGRRLSYSTYCAKIFNPLMERLGLPDATPHWCRHTFASRLYSAGVDELLRHRLLGHSDKNVTSNYTHTNLAQLTEAIRKLA